jgi:Carbohydrate binding domain.
MPLFVSPADVMLRMQLSDELTGIEEIVTSGIIGAQLHVERILGSKIGRQNVDVQFFVDGDAFSGVTPGGVFRLEMPSGFLRTDVPLQVSTTAPNLSATPNSPFGVFETIDVDFLRVDHNRGYLLLDVATYANCYVRVIGVSGYEDGTRPVPTLGILPYNGSNTYAQGDQVTAVGVVYTCLVDAPVGIGPSNPNYWTKAYVPMEQIPTELYEAILTLVPMVFNSNQTTTRSQEAVQQYRVLTDHAAMLLQPFIRTRGFSFRPV